MPRRSPTKAPSKSKGARRTKARKARKHPLFRFLLRSTLFAVLLGIAGGLVFCAIYFLRASRFEMAQVANMPERSLVLDRNGAEIGRMHGQNRRVVPIEEVSSYFLMSIIAREDVRFHEHCGVDLRGLARATLRNLKDRSMTQGASTITMQLSRNTFDLSEGKEWYHELDRKFLEIFVTLRIESKYSKNEILEHYVNRIFWGHSMLGIEAAARAYLQKPAKDLTLSESAMLAGIVRGPNAFSPFRSLSLATRERDVVLDRLVFYHFITPEQAATAKAEPLRIRPKVSRSNKERYSMDAVSRELSYHLEKNNIKIGGLTIHTTLDKGIQARALSALNARLQAVESRPGYAHQTRAAYQRSDQSQAPAYLQGALVCIDNATGGIVATIGGRSAEESRFNRAYHAKRQVGSLFKPFVFQAAYDRGLRPQTSIDDGPLKKGEISAVSENWAPNNSDGRYLGLIESRKALIGSRNTSSVRVGDYATLQHVSRAAEIAGFDLFQWEERRNGKTPKSATAYLGAWEASPEEVARAYTIFPNLGNYKQPYLISKIVDRHGKTVFNKASSGGVEIAEKPLSQGATYEVSQILAEITSSGTAASLRKTHGFRAPSAGKTGTTDQYKDAWFAGYTSALTCAVWVGLDTPKTIMKRGYGSTLALPIWADVMKAASLKTEFRPARLEKEISRQSLELCRSSGRAATQNCRHHGTSYQDLVPLDLVSLSRTPCTIHPPSAVAADQIAQRPASSRVKSKPREGRSLLERLFGSKKSPPAPPPSPLPRAILVPDPAEPSDAQAIMAKPQVRPTPAPAQVPPPRPARAELVVPPAPPSRAIVVEEEPVPTRRAVIVQDPQPAAPRAIQLD